jgi:hypothetical protein
MSEQPAPLPKLSDKERIDNAGEWCPCRICEMMFRRIRLSLRYCQGCEQAFCEGEHGSFAYGHGKCVICGAHRDYKTRQKKKQPTPTPALALSH